MDCNANIFDPLIATNEFLMVINIGCDLDRIDICNRMANDCDEIDRYDISNEMRIIIYSLIKISALILISVVDTLPIISYGIDSNLDTLTEYHYNEYDNQNDTTIIIDIWYKIGTASFTVRLFVAANIRGHAVIYFIMKVIDGLNTTISIQFHASVVEINQLILILAIQLSIGVVYYDAQTICNVCVVFIIFLHFAFFCFIFCLFFFLSCKCSITQKN